MTTTPEPRPGRPATEREEVPYVDDPWTKLFVLAVIAVFALVFANAIFLGTGGLLTATPTPTPTSVATASPSPAPSPSASPTPSPTLSPTPSPTPSATPAASPAASPTATP